MNVDRIREVSDAATIDRLHGEPASDSTLEIEVSKVADMNIGQLHDWVQLDDLIKTLPADIRDGLIRHYREQVALAIVESAQV